MTAHLATVEGLDPYDGHDERGGHPIGLLRASQRGGILLPEQLAVTDAIRGNEQRPVAMPGFGFPRLADGVEHLLP